MYPVIDPLLSSAPRQPKATAAAIADVNPTADASSPDRFSQRDVDLYSELSADLIRLAAALVGPTDAEDLLSETVLEVFTSSRWGAVTNRRSYLFQSLVNRAKMRHRSTARRRHRELRVGTAPPATSEARADADVVRAVLGLTVRQRAIVHLIYWADLTAVDAAERLGLSLRTVERELQRAKSQLKEQL